MTDADARLLADALGLPVERVGAVLAVVRAAVGQPAADRAPERQAARAWLSVDDVARLTGFSPETVQDKARVGIIPMFRVGAGREWRMTPAAFDAWERRMEAEGTPREAAYSSRRPRT